MPNIALQKQTVTMHLRLGGKVLDTFDAKIEEPNGGPATIAVDNWQATLAAGFTTVRDLGTEGAQYADVELKQAVNQGIIPGPRILAYQAGGTAAFADYEALGPKI